MKRTGKAFKDLEKIWYDKLGEVGFDDIEDTSNEKRLLKEWDHNFFRNQFNQIKYDATLQYFSQAKKLLVSHRFKSLEHKKIWALHCEGITEREIARRLNYYKKSMVHYVIAEISQWIKND